MTVTDESRAEEIAADALDEEYSSYQIEETYREQNTWVVRATADGADVNVHINTETEETTVGEIGDEE